MLGIRFRCSMIRGNVVLPLFTFLRSFIRNSKGIILLRQLKVSIELFSLAPRA